MNETAMQTDEVEMLLHPRSSGVVFCESDARADTGPENGRSSLT